MHPILKKGISLIFVSSISILLVIIGCDPVGGIGKIIGYRYPVSKKELNNYITPAISSNPNIRRDSTKEDIAMREYNDGDRFYTIYVTKDNRVYEFTFGFIGSKEYLQYSDTSEIGIIYAREGDKGGSQGAGDFTWHRVLKHKLIKIFEDEFLKNLDSLVGKHPVKMPSS